MYRLKAKSLREEKRQEQRVVYEQLDVKEGFGVNKKNGAGYRENLELDERSDEWNQMMIETSGQCWRQKMNTENDRESERK